jgi:hypothetical protein
MEDEILGRLSENAHLPRALNGSFAYGGRQIPVVLFPQKKSLPQCVALARAIVSEISQIDERAKNAATDDMLELYNENWREYGEIDEDGEHVEVSNPELTEAEFKSRLTLTNVSVHGDSAVSFSYDIEDLFAGHEIVLSSVTTACRNFHVELVG